MESCAGKCAKYFLFLYNLLFVISGAGVMGIGIWVRVDKDFKQIQDLLQISTDQYMYTAAYVLIGFGGFVFLVGFLGCCGAVTENKCLLGSYIFFLVLVFAGEFAGGIYAAVYKDQAIESLLPNLQSTLNKDKYKPSNSTTYGGNTVAVAWDFIQVWFACCGANNYTDYGGIRFRTANQHVPITCCVLDNSDPINPQPKDENRCQQEAASPDNTSATYLNTEGCVQGVEDMIKKYANVIIGVGVGIAFLQFLGIALACCVCRGGSKDDY